MHKIFLDTDVILDVFAQRQPHYDHSAKLLTLVERRNVNAVTSPLVFANLHYLLRKLKSREFALQGLRKLRIIVGILTIDEKTIDQALNSEFTDFEDAIQFYAAQQENVDFIITRNKKDFQNDSIAVCTPEEYLAMLKNNY